MTLYSGLKKQKRVPSISLALHVLVRGTLTVHYYKCLKKKNKNPQINKKQVFSRNYNPGGDGFGRMRELKFFGFREIYIIKAKFHLHPSQFSLKFLHLTSMLLHIYCESCAEEERALVLAIPLKSCKSLGRLLDLSPSFLALVSLYIKCA